MNLSFDAGAPATDLDEMAVLVAYHAADVVTLLDPQQLANQPLWLAILSEHHLAPADTTVNVVDGARYEKTHPSCHDVLTSSKVDGLGARYRSGIKRFRCLLRCTLP
jgi:hypothetical protein